MIPGVLTRYIGRRFASTLLMILAAVSLTILLADYVEILRRFSDEAGFSAASGLRLSLLRVPVLLEALLPFAFLFAALLSLLALSRTLELVVARASGVSVWGFLAAPALIAVLLGLASSLLLNPLTVRLNEEAQALQAGFSPGGSVREEGVWFRQESSQGPSIVHGDRSSVDGTVLYGVSVYVFDTEGRFKEKVGSPRATFAAGAWTLSDATVTSAARAPQQTSSYVLPTKLSVEEVQRTNARPETLSVWSLPGFIRTAGQTGVNTAPFILAFHTLLSRPLFLLAMVAIAATVSLRLSRHGGAWALILTGVGAGFLLYVLTEIVNDLGGNDIIDPVLAAWAPSIIALTLGATALFHQEDG